VGVASRLRAQWRGGPLSDRNFRLLTAGQFTSTAGDFCYAVALPWLVLSTHGGPVLLGTVLACYGVPRTVLMPLGGVLADKLGPRAIMLTADLVRCGLVVVLAVFAAKQIVSLAALGPIAALLGAGEGLFIPASFTIMPSLLRPDWLQAGNALNSAAVQFGSLLGPALGGILVASAGSAPAFAVDAASFGISALALALIVPRTRASLSGAGTSRDGTSRDGNGSGELDAAGAAGAGAAGTGGAGAGADAAGPARPAAPGTPDEAGAGPGKPAGVWSLLRHSRLLQVLIMVAAVANLTSAGTFEVALPSLAHMSFGATGYGVLVACYGAGAVIGTLAATRAGRLRRPAPVACGAFLIAAASICLVPFLGGLPGAAAAIVVLGAGNGFGNIIMITLLQQWAPPAMLGRIMGVVMLASMGTFPVSVVLSGVLVRAIGPIPFFPVAGAVLAVAILGALTQREIRDFGTAAAEPAEPQAPTPDPVRSTRSSAR
jgi:predicted MFS family arabinose efflux permease